MDTAIDWLLNNLPERYKNAMLTTCQEEIKQAKELFKSQIINAVDDNGSYQSSGDVYYEQTYER